MVVSVTKAQLQVLAPNIRAIYADAFKTVDAELDKFKINATAIRLRHFMAQILHETGGFSILIENMNYSAERLPVVWPSRFKPKGLLDPKLYAHNPEKLGNEVYGGRMGNNATNGYLYRGRGLIQTTGHDGYKTATDIVKKAYPGTQVPDFVVTPDDVITAAWCLRVAAAEYADYGCNQLADEDKGNDAAIELKTVRAITKKINGGYIGIADRIEWLKRTKKLWH